MARRCLKVDVEFFGLPQIADIFGSSLVVAFDGETIGELVHHLDNMQGTGKKNLFFNKEGSLDPWIVVMVNEGALAEQQDELIYYKLHEGDRVTFLVLVGGG